jgi:hypothetical protein
MINPCIWGPLGVEEFFARYNWSGDPPKLQPLINSSQQPTLLHLSLGEFLHSQNWTGRQTVKEQPREIPSLSITLSVGEYFQGMGWQGSPKIAALPQKKAPLAREENTEMNLTDLSQLF